MGYAIVQLLAAILQLIVVLIIAQAILSWLIAFNVVNMRNRVVYQIARFLDQITDPLLRPFRRVIPSFNGIDISPIALLLLIMFLQTLLGRTVGPWLIRNLG